MRTSRNHLGSPDLLYPLRGNQVQVFLDLLLYRSGSVLQAFLRSFVLVNELVQRPPGADLLFAVGANDDMTVFIKDQMFVLATRRY